MFSTKRISSWTRIAWCSSLLVCLSVALPSGATAQQYVDPRVSMSGYAAWCASQGGTVDTSGGVGCRVSPGRSTYSGGTGLGSAAGQALGQAMAPVFYQFGYAIGCMLVGGCSDPRAAQAAQQRVAEIEAQRQAAEAERLRRQEQERRQFQDAQQRMLGELRGYDPQGLQPRGLDLPTLEPRLGTLGATELKPRELTVASALSTRGRVRCAVSLLYKANKAYVDINTQAALWEAAYLSNEAANISRSASYRPNVQCPPEPPDVGAGVPTQEAEAQLQRIQQSAILFARVQQQIADIETQKATVRNSDAKVKETERQVTETRRRVEQIQQQRAVAPPVVAGQPSVQQQQDDGALAEAMAALQQAQTAYQSSRELLKNQQDQLTDMQRNLDGSTRELQGQMRDWSAPAGSSG